MIRNMLIALAAALTQAGCASLAARDPLQVTVAGIEPMQEKGEVQDKTFATGVSNAGGTVPGFSDAVVEVPVTVSMLRMVRQVIGVKDAAQADQIRYSMSGKLGSHRFSASGEFSLGPQPGAAPAGTT